MGDFLKISDVDFKLLEEAEKRGLSKLVKEVAKESTDMVKDVVKESTDMVKDIVKEVSKPFSLKSRKGRKGKRGRRIK